MTYGDRQRAEAAQLKRSADRERARIAALTDDERAELDRKRAVALAMLGQDVERGNQ